MLSADAIVRLISSLTNSISKSRGTYRTTSAKQSGTNLGFIILIGIFPIAVGQLSVHTNVM